MTVRDATAADLQAAVDWPGSGWSTVGAILPAGAQAAVDAAGRLLAIYGVGQADVDGVASLYAALGPLAEARDALLQVLSTACAGGLPARPETLILDGTVRTSDDMAVAAWRWAVDRVVRDQPGLLIAGVAQTDGPLLHWRLLRQNG